MDLNDLINRGCTQTIERLITMLVDVPGMDTTSPDDRAQTVETLRELANTLEKAPGSIKGLMLIAAAHLVGDQEGINRTQIIVGSQPFVAATYMLLEPHAVEAMHTCLPYLASMAMAEAEAANQEAPNHG